MVCEWCIHPDQVPWVNQQHRLSGWDSPHMPMPFQPPHSQYLGNLVFKQLGLTSAAARCKYLTVRRVLWLISSTHSSEFLQTSIATLLFW